MGIFDNLKFLNPFSAPFKANKTLDDLITKQLEDNSVGMSVTEYDMNAMGMGAPNVGAGFGDFSTRVVDFNQIFINKRQRIAKYREMSFYPEISEALDIMCDEAIVENHEGVITHLEIRKELPKRVERLMREEFKYVTDVALNVGDNLYGLYKKWLIEGELYVEIILDDSKKNIIGYKILPAFTTFPVYSKTGVVKGFLQSMVDEQGTEIMQPMESNQVAYVHWGNVGKDLLDVRGYLESSIRPYNQLKNLEDALIVYRLVRAPERRVWNIEVGRQPNAKAEEYIKKIIHKYKRKLNYDPNTGSILSSRNVQSLAEDFWFAKRDGQGTSVETLAGGMNLGELDDVRYFLAKMYKSLKLPKTRWDSQLGQQSYTTGRELDREELKFNLFVIQTQKRFKKMIKDIFMQQIKFKYKDDKKMKKYLLSSLYDVDFTQANFFKEIKDLELMETRLNILGTAIAYMNSPDEPNNPLAREMVLRHYFQMSDQEYDLNKELLEKERKENLEIRDEEDEREDEREIAKKGNGEEEPEEPEEPEVDGTPQDKNLEPDKDEPEKKPEKKPNPFAKKNDKDKEKEEDSEYHGYDNIMPSKKMKDFLKKKKKNRKKLL